MSTTTSLPHRSAHDAGDSHRLWQAGRHRMDLSVPRVMAIVNVTPDSFSDGGRHDDPRRAIEHARQCLEEGADILDVGGESTRPGAPPVEPDQEWARVQPVLQELVRWGCPVSVDTRRVEVMRRALDLGVDIINDVQALQAPGAVELLADQGAAGVCLMHMRAQPQTMQEHADYRDVVAEVGRWLQDRAQAVVQAGVAPQRIVLDPGIGFAKSVQHNFALLARQGELAALGRPLLVGWSRKSSLGAVTGRANATDRVAASVAAAALALEAGASILRVHDVAATVDTVSVWKATMAQRIGATMSPGAAPPPAQARNPMTRKNDS